MCFQCTRAQPSQCFWMTVGKSFKSLLRGFKGLSYDKSLQIKTAFLPGSQKNWAVRDGYDRNGAASKLLEIPDMTSFQTWGRPCFPSVCGHLQQLLFDSLLVAVAVGYLPFLCLIRKCAVFSLLVTHVLPLKFVLYTCLPQCLPCSRRGWRPPSSRPICALTAEALNSQTAAHSHLCSQRRTVP